MNKIFITEEEAKIINSALSYFYRNSLASLDFTEKEKSNFENLKLKINKFLKND